VILTAWGSDVLLLPREGFLKRKMVGYVLQHADAFTSDSEYMAGEMRKMMRDDRKEILVANFGINVPVTGGEKENVIYSNRLHKKLYRIDKVIEGFHRFVKGGAVGDWKLVIAGSGEETGNLRGLVSGLDLDGQVLFAGWLGRDENAKYYARARVFVSIPESDATAISLLEAMASGCIPIVSDLPANREWVTDKMNGIVVRDLSENFFEGVLKMDREKIAVINRDIIAERGTKEGNRKKFIGLYERVLKNR
jgi:glycosyltransferase involved in cell wall biosynthesis